MRIHTEHGEVTATGLPVTPGDPSPSPPGTPSEPSQPQQPVGPPPVRAGQAGPGPTDAAAAL